MKIQLKTKFFTFLCFISSIFNISDILYLSVLIFYLRYFDVAILLKYFSFSSFMFRYFNIFNMFLVSIFYIFSSIIFHFIFRRGYIMIRKSYKAPAWCSGRITKGERTSASKFTESICRIYLPLTIVQTYATSKLIRSTNFPRASVFRIPVKKVRSPRFAFNRK